MNERIRELAEQAGLLPKEIGPVVETRHMKNKQQDLAKFAELLVRECIDTVSDCSVEYCTRPQIVSEIKQHFGVEE